MKTITREIKMLKYTFANVEVSGENTSVTSVNYVESAKKLTRAETRAYSQQFGGAIIVATQEFTKKYVIPVEWFIKACEEYAAAVEAGEIDGIDEDSEDDEEDDNSVDE